MSDPLPTVLLRHEGYGATHHDWMLADPRSFHEPRSRLWTGRVGAPSSQWDRLERWAVERIGSHRQRYLTYEGPLSGDRGRVVRVDEGSFEPVIWTDTRILIDLSMRHCRGRVDLSMIDGDRWCAVLSTPKGAAGGGVPV